MLELAYVIFEGGGMSAVVDVLLFALVVVILVWAIRQFLAK